MSLGAIGAGYGNTAYAYLAKSKSENKSEKSDSEQMDYREQVAAIKQTLLEKIQNGEGETSYQIGSQSFTEKEWDKFLDRFDSIEEIIRELMRERQERMKEEQEKKEIAEEMSERSKPLETDNMVFAESTTCTYPAADPEDEDIRYITWYTEEGIFCRKAGQSEGYEWTIAFENQEQYHRVMEFLSQFPSDGNLWFAARENFWTDFLNHEMDTDSFQEFVEANAAKLIKVETDAGQTVTPNKEETFVQDR